MYFGVNDSIFSGNEQQKVYLLQLLFSSFIILLWPRPDNCTREGKTNTFCCSLPENILSLTSNSSTQKYIHFIQSTFISVDTQPLHKRAFYNANRRPLILFYYTLGMIKFQLGNGRLLVLWNAL